MVDNVRVIKPQPGPQEQFLGSAADIAIYGGAAGGGKSWALLMEALRHAPSNDQFSAVYFRRNTTQVRNPGGLWDESTKLYPLSGATPVQHVLEWSWPNGGKVKFAHLEHESTVYDWQGAQIPLICFDELTHFTREQFFYMLTRNRSMCGVKPYVRASTNPDSDSWVAQFIAWWIDESTGLPIPERSGVLRYFVRLKDEMHWADTPEELITRLGGGEEVRPKSVTFIGAKLADNPALLAADPDYMANLLAQSAVERARLADGNWKIRPSGGEFKREWVNYYDKLDARSMPRLILVDPAGGKKRPGNDYTTMWVIGLGEDENFYVLDVVRDKLNLTGRTDALFRLHRLYRPLQVRYERYSMQADIEHIQVEQAHRSYRFPILEVAGQTSKEDRVRRLIPLFEKGRVWLPETLHYTDYSGQTLDLIRVFVEQELLAFPLSAHDDMTDSLARLVEPGIDTPWPGRRLAAQQAGRMAAFGMLDETIGY